MSYEIKITADSISELTGKLLALAAATQPDVIEGTAAVAAAEVKPKRSGKAAASANTAAGTGSSTETKTDAAAVEPNTLSDDAGNGATNAENASTNGTSDTSTTSAATATSLSKILDFDREVAPVVLEAVKVKGKPWVQEILSQFGVERASQVPDEQFGELVDAIKAGL
jgi:hypothetical protein